MVIGICEFLWLGFMGVPERSFISLEQHIVDILQRKDYALVTLSENINC